MICFVFKPRFVPSVYAVLLASRGKGTPAANAAELSVQSSELTAEPVQL